MRRSPGKKTFWTSEFRFVLWFALALTGLTSVPYLLGYLLPFEGSHFSGGLVFETDFNAYLAFARQAEKGSWLFHNPFTPEPHGAALFNLEWLVLGKLAFLLRITPAAVFQLLRVFSIFLLCGAFYCLASLTLETTLMRRLALVTASLGGGFGWLWIPQLGLELPRSLFLDIGSGLHPFYWIQLHPHFLVAQSFAIVSLLLLLRAEKMGKAWHYVQAGLAYLAVGAMRPFDMVYLLMATGLFTIWRALTKPEGSRRFLLRTLACAVTAPLVVYYVWIFRHHPIFRWWTIQNALGAPSLPTLVISMGLVAAPFVWGLFHLTRDRAAARALVFACAVSSLALVQSSAIFSFATQFVTALMIPVVLTAAIPLERSVARLVSGRRGGRIGVAAFVALNSLTSMALWGYHVQGAAKGRFRIDGEAMRAYEWLSQRSRPREIVLASFQDSNRIPRFADNDVFCGYVFSTVNYAEKSAIVSRFFDPGVSDAFRRAILEQYKIRYILVSGKDKLTAGYDPTGSPFLLEVFRDGAVTLYKVL